MVVKIEGLNEIKSYLYTVKGQESELELQELHLFKVDNVYFGKCNCVQGSVESLWQNKWMTLNTTGEERALEILKGKIKEDIYQHPYKGAFFFVIQKLHIKHTFICLVTTR